MTKIPAKKDLKKLKATTARDRQTAETVRSSALPARRLLTHFNETPEEQQARIERIFKHMKKKEEDWLRLSPEEQREELETWKAVMKAIAENDE